MKPAPFDYYDPATLDEALAILHEHAETAKILAGGQSLMPLMNMRLARPGVVVDINRIRDLDYVTADGGILRIGAVARQRAVERSAVVAERWPLVAEAIGFVGHVQIRNRGTVVGSIAHADPAAELPAVAVALDAEVVARSAAGERVIPAGEFFVTYLTTQLGPDEMVTEVRFPQPPPDSGWAFIEVTRRHGDFALVGVAAGVVLDGGTIGDARLVFTGVGGTPARASSAEQALRGEAPTPEVLRRAADLAPGELEPDSDIHASAEYRRDVAAVLARRALETAVRRAGGERS